MQPIWIDLLFALLAAGLLTLLFVPVFGWRRPGRADGAFLWFFLLIFLVTWVGGVWLTPFGPVLWGRPWAVFLVMGLTAAVLIAAAAPPQSPRVRRASGPEDDPRVAEVAAFNWFFWLLLAITATALLFAYL